MIMHKTLALLSIFSKPGLRNIKFAGWRQRTLVRKLLVFLLVCVNLALLFAYILGVNNNASIGYEIKTLQSQNSILRQENKKLNLQIAEQSSVNNIQQQLVSLGYVKTVQPIYINTPSAVTLR